MLNVLSRNLFLADTSMRTMSKGQSKIPVVERVAELAMKLGQKHLAEYGATTTRRDFTHRQLMSCLILRAYLKTRIGECWICWPPGPACANGWDWARSCRILRPCRSSAAAVRYWPLRKSWWLKWDG